MRSGQKIRHFMRWEDCNPKTQSRRLRPEGPRNSKGKKMASRSKRNQWKAQILGMRNNKKPGAAPSSQQVPRHHAKGKLCPVTKREIQDGAGRIKGEKRNAVGHGSVTEGQGIHRNVHVLGEESNGRPGGESSRNAQK